MPHVTAALVFYEITYLTHRDIHKRYRHHALCSDQCCLFVYSITITSTSKTHGKQSFRIWWEDYSPARRIDTMKSAHADCVF